MLLNLFKQWIPSKGGEKHICSNRWVNQMLFCGANQKNCFLRTPNLIVYQKFITFQLFSPSLSACHCFQMFDLSCFLFDSTFHDLLSSPEHFIIMDNETSITFELPRLIVNFSIRPILMFVHNFESIFIGSSIQETPPTRNGNTNY